MLSLAGASPIGAVLESNFYRSRATGELRRLPGPIVEVFCRCDHEVANARYRRRAGSRAAGHFDTVRTDVELWNDEVTEPVAGGWPVIEVDTNVPVDVVAVTAAVRAATAASEGSQRQTWWPPEQWQSMLDGAECPMCLDAYLATNEHSDLVMESDVAFVCLHRNQTHAGYCVVVLKRHAAEHADPGALPASDGWSAPVIFAVPDAGAVLRSGHGVATADAARSGAAGCDDGAVATRSAGRPAG